MNETDVKKAILDSDYSVKNVKTFAYTHDGQPMQCSLYKGKKRIAVVIDAAHGGNFQYDTINKELEQEFFDFCNSFKDVYCEDHGFTLKTYGADCVIDVLVNKFQEDKDYKRLCKTKVVIRLHSEPDSYRYYNIKYNNVDRKAIDKQIENKYGEDLKEIVNRRFV